MHNVTERQYGCIFIRLATAGSQMYEIPRDSERIRTFSRPRSSKVNRKCICNFLLVIILDVSP